ncbi:hypothetical protein T440DRAFT_476962 [Plenodomus tracheiphilus IPT5]|uniref:Rhodopsin domain-containing protein n=1 Tax=Plenodomus tracheiphilus IPT5 TaxID=1408161 RepID=A0A6A7BC74_9PLEO|nr:hypothetical protein T440DRAFT_476962 [Plenodomus tracheiphilus IPT5]
MRVLEKERLRISDYFLLTALPPLLIGTALLQSIFDDLHARWPSGSDIPASSLKTTSRVTSRLTTAIELLWLTIYCVKASFLAQFKFYKPLYAYVSPSLTRHYWTCIGVCAISFLLTLIVPIVLCPNSDDCRYLTPRDTVAWETALGTLDIITDLLVISVPVSLVYLANFTLSNAVINTSFKSLSVFTVVITACRVAFQFDKEDGQINYRSLSIWLAIEAAVSVVMGSVSGYRTIALNLHTARKRRQPRHPTQLGTWVTLDARKSNEVTDNNIVARTNISG